MPTLILLTFAIGILSFLIAIATDRQEWYLIGKIAGIVFVVELLALILCE